MIDAFLGGLNPKVFHLSNVFMHIIACFLVFLLLQNLKFQKNSSLLLTLLFAVHPVLVPAVAWIPGRNDSLLAIFCLASFIMYLKYLENDTVEKPFKGVLPNPVFRGEGSLAQQKTRFLASLGMTSRIKYLIFHSILLLFALFTKETALILTGVIVSYHLIIRKDRLFSSFQLKTYFYWVISLCIWQYLRNLAFKNPLPMNLPDVFSMLLKSFSAPLIYLGKALIPLQLSVLPTMTDSTVVYGALALLVVIYLYFKTEKENKPLYLFGIAWFFLFILPALVQKDTALYIHEHRIYLPLVGLLISFNTGFSSKENIKPALKILAICIFIIFVFISFNRMNDYKDKISFWQNAVKTSPTAPLAHRNLGAMYYLDGKLDAAEVEFINSLKYNPYEPMAHNNLGLIYMNRGKLKEAEAEYLKEISINPEYDNVYYNLGLLYYNEKKYQELEAAWKKCVDINPRFIQALRGLAILYYQAKDYGLSAKYASKLKSLGIQLEPELEKLIK